LVFLGVGFAAPPQEVVSEIHRLIDSAERKDWLTLSRLSEELQNPLLIQKYLNYGFQEGEWLFGISLAKVEPNASTKIPKEFTQGLASRLPGLPFLQEKFGKTDLPPILWPRYATYQIFYGLEMRVEKTERIRYVEAMDYIGYLTLVKTGDVTVIKIADEKAFVLAQIADLKIVKNDPDTESVLALFDYATRHGKQWDISVPKVWLMKLYTAAMLLNRGDRLNARDALAALPEDLSRLFASGFFDDEDFLLLGDLFLIFGEESRAFAAWAYGMQRNPNNQRLEERFRDYSDR